MEADGIWFPPHESRVTSDLPLRTHDPIESSGSRSQTSHPPTLGGEITRFGG